LLAIIVSSTPDELLLLLLVPLVPELVVGEVGDETALMIGP
jgi:hypothetical protein